MEFRDLKAQYASLKEEVDQAILSSIATSRFIGGEPVANIERRLATYVGVRHCVSCANGTDALQLALMAWGVGPGDAVFVPDFTFFSTGEVVSAVGATPVFVDVCDDTFNMDSASLEYAYEYVTSNTDLKPTTVIPVDLFGFPADYTRLLPLCRELSLLVLEDGAQGFGGTIGGRRACSFGDISTTSFFPAKPLGCYGDGGAVFTDDDEWAALIRSYAVHGKGAGKYDNVRVGMNSRLDTIQAVILGVKLDAFELHEVDDVNERARWYDELLAGCGLTLPQIPEGLTSSWAQYTVCLPEGINRDEVQARLREAGVPTAVYYPRPMHEQPAFASSSLCPDGCPVTRRLCRAVLSLPMGPYLTQQDAEVVASRLQTFRLK